MRNLLVAHLYRPRFGDVQPFSCLFDLTQSCGQLGDGPLVAADALFTSPRDTDYCLASARDDLVPSASGRAAVTGGELFADVT
jgi:hypothetical protein